MPIPASSAPVPPTHEPTDEQIALLCDIGQASAAKPEPDQAADIQRLLADGYIEPGRDAGSPKYQLTAKAERFLTTRGVGLNEA